MSDIFVGSVSVGVVPDARGWQDSLRAQLVPSSNAVGQQVGQNVSQGIVRGMSQKKPDVARQGEESGGAFGDAFSKRLKASLDALPKAKIDADSTPAEKKVQELRARLEELKKQGVDISSDKAMAELEKVSLELDKISGKSKDIRLSFNTAEARAQLDLLSRDIRDKTGGGGPGFLGSIGNVIPGLAGTGGGASGIGALAPAGGMLTNPYVWAAGAAAAPFAGQAVGGLGVAGLGAGLAGLGVAGTLGLGASSAADIQTAQQAVASAQASQATAQANLNKLRDSGKATTTQLAAAEATLAGAQQKTQAAQKALSDMTPMTAGQEKVRQGFTDLQKSAEASLTKIGTAFVPVMESILGTARDVIGKMTPVFAGAMRMIAGPVQRFADTILNAFARPAVQKSITDVANAFGKILDAFTPDIPGIADSLAQAISRMADAIAKNPKAFADFLNFLFQIVIMVIDAIAYLTDFADYIEQHFMPAVQHFVNFWKDVWRDVAGAVAFAFDHVLEFCEGIIRAVGGALTGVGSGIARYFSGLAQAIITPFNAVKTYFTTNFDKWWAANGDAVKEVWRVTWDVILAIFRVAVAPIVLAAKVFWDVLRALFSGGSSVISALWRAAWSAITVIVRTNMAIIEIIVKLFWGVLTAAFQLGASVIGAIWNTLWSGLRAVATIMFAAIRLVVKIGWDLLVGIFTVGLNLITGRWSAAWDAIKNVGEQIWNAIDQFFRATFSAIDQFWSDRLHNMQNVSVSVWNFIKQFWQDSLNAILNAVRVCVDAVGRVWDGIKDKMATPIRWVAQHVLVHLFNAIDDITKFVSNTQPLKSASDTLQRMSSGGYVAHGAGSKTDDQLALLARGEVVVPTDLVNAGAVDHLRGILPGFHKTGAVPGKVATGEVWIHVPGHGNPPYDFIPISLPGYASGGQIENTMLSFMLSKRGAAYSEANRWGRPPWDCSSLVYDAARSAGVPIPQSVAIANTEAEWFAGWNNSYAYRNKSEIQTGDILASHGASADPSPWGGIGHIGMAAAPNVMISALGSQYGVTESGIGDLTVGIRLGGKGGKGILGTIWSGIVGGVKAVIRTAADILKGIGKFAGVAVDLAKGDIAGAATKLLGSFPTGAGGAAGNFAKMLIALPPKLIKSALGKIADSVKSYVSNQQAQDASAGGGPGTPVSAAGSGVMRWQPTVLQALNMLNLSSSLANQVLHQIQTESGGNPNAINNWDINAQHGDPSRGLLQVIGSTFAAYHVPGTSGNIYDPLANIAAAINYAQHRYGPTLMSGGMGLGSGHGYDDGGWLPPGSTFAYNGTGRPELIMNADQMAAAMSGGPAYHAHFDGLTGEAIEGHVRTAFQAMNITQGNLQRQGRRR